MSESSRNIEKIQSRNTYTFKKKYLSFKSSIFFLKIWYKLLINKKFFKEISPDYPLTREQKIAILTEEDRNLVIAGAGTGKTSVIIAKVVYLIEKRKVEPKELLLLTFGKDPKELIEARAQRAFNKRGKKYNNIEMNAKTFHSYGRELCKEVYGERPLSKFDDKKKKDRLDNFIYRQIKNLKKDDPVFIEVVKYFSEYLAPPPNLEKDLFQTLNEYQNFIRTIQKLTLKGDNVKSYGELRIANFLAIKGIEYDYEREWDGEPLGNIYKPDFTVFYPDSHKKIIIEYFGVDRRGKTKPGILPKKYNSQMNSKKDHHHKFNTDFIALHYYDLQEGNLEAILHRELQKRGVAYKPISEQELIKLFNERRYYDIFAKLSATFLQQFKSNQLKIDEIKEKAGSDSRSLAFIKIFEWILSMYEQELKKDNSFDYSDMINDGIDILNENRATRNLKWIIVDEFQDISRGRTNLLYALIKQNPEAKVIVVGDDWQSIYRFAGSDIGIVQKFEYFFDNSVEFRLNESFRFNSEINKFSQFFIMDKFYKRNSSVQINKNIKVLKINEVFSNKIFLHWKNQGSVEKEFELLSIVKRIKKYKDSDKLFILARYNRNLPTEDEMRKIKNIWGKNVFPMSIHKSKGEEAEFVIITDLSSDFLSFPSEHVDDPLLNLVLAASDNKDLEIKGEERRLFYVGVTRAKNEVHLISNWASPSMFTEEILRYKEVGANHVAEWDIGSSKNIKCPRCKGNIVGKNCSNSLFCDFRAPLCQKCNGPCVQQEGRSILHCVDLDCGFYYRTCPEKGCSGQLIPKVPNNPDEESDIFLGCSNHNLGRCDYLSYKITAKCSKCGDGDLYRRNRNSDGKPFVACDGFHSDSCDFATDFKNPLYKNSHLVSEYY